MSLMSHGAQRESLTRALVVGSPFRKDYSFESKYSPSYVRYDQPEGLLEYELTRQKEKSRILEERLKNKEIFIAQMKEFQAELTQAFDESQQQLQYYKSRCEQLDVANGRSREAQEILDLKRLLNAVEQDKRKLEEELKQQKNPRQRSQSRPSMHKSKTDQYLNRDASLTVLKDSLASSLAKYLNSTVEEVSKEIRPVGKFLSSFFTMVETCNPNQMPSGLKEQLRFGWKWVKAIVKEHTETTPHKPSLIKENRSSSHAEHHRISALAKLLNVQPSEVQEQLESMLHEQRQADRIVKLVAEFCGLAPESSLKHVERALRQRIGRTRHDQQ